MKRAGWVFLICCLLILALCAGCSQNDKTKDTGQEQNQNTPNDNDTNDNAVPPSLGDLDEDMTADKLFSLIGKQDTDVDAAMGQNATLSDDATGNRVFKTTILGEDANVTFVKDADMKIQTVAVTVNKTVADKWKTDLKERYGDSIDDVWEKDDAHVQMTTSGDNVVFAISRIAK
ncbi:MAG: hypothetical protein VB086_00560 [Clostridiaceae bacterium]|nr:hypothetical protein [Clostridiaceae bacterium]